MRSRIRINISWRALSRPLDKVRAKFVRLVTKFEKIAAFNAA
jgi:hypothetical protein